MKVKGQNLKQVKKVETRGRKPLDQEKVKGQLKERWERWVSRMEKEVFKSVPEKQSDINQHIKETVRRSVA